MNDGSWVFTRDGGLFIVIPEHGHSTVFVLQTKADAIQVLHEQYPGHPRLDGIRLSITASDLPDASMKPMQSFTGVMANAARHQVEAFSRRHGSDIDDGNAHGSPNRVYWARGERPPETPQMAFGFTNPDGLHTVAVCHSQSQVRETIDALPSPSRDELSKLTTMFAQYGMPVDSPTPRVLIEGLCAAVLSIGESCISQEEEEAAARQQRDFTLN